MAESNSTLSTADRWKDIPGGEPLTEKHVDAALLNINEAKDLGSR